MDRLPPNEVIADCQAAAKICTTEGSQLERDVEQLQEALRKYGQHTDECNVIMGWGFDLDCDCGLAEILQMRLRV
jgi:hypothetical protein